MNTVTVAAISASLVFGVGANELSIATGGEGGGYNTRGTEIGAKIEDLSNGNTEVTVMVTNGSGHNIELFDEGKADVFFAQEDSLNVTPPNRAYRSKPIGQEAIYHFVNEKSDFTDPADYEGDKDVYIVLVADSGSAITWANFVKEDSDYGKNPILWADDLWEAISYVSDGTYDGKQIGGALHVTKLGKLDRELAQDFSHNVRIGSTSGDKDFNDAENVNGDALYTKCELENAHLGGFKTTSIFSDPDTLCMNAVIAYSIDLDSDIQKNLKKAIVRTTNK